MSPDVKSNLARIKNTSQEINAMATKATALIKSLDEALGRAGVGYAVDGPRINSSTGENKNGDLVDIFRDLHYGRVDDGWCLFVEETAEVTDDEGEKVKDSDNEVEIEIVGRTALAKASRELRLAAMPVIPAFIEKIANELETNAKRLETSIQATEAVFGELEEALGDK